MLLRCRIPLADFELEIERGASMPTSPRFSDRRAPARRRCSTPSPACATIADGEIEIDGQSTFFFGARINLPPQQRGIGYVPQEGALFPASFRAAEYSLRRRARNPNPGVPTGSKWLMSLKSWKLAVFWNRPVTKLSGGEAQRVALARAILSRPRLLLLDEPLAALDIGLKERILPYLGRVRDEFTIPMIYVTHNLTEVLTLADWVLMIQQGQIDHPRCAERRVTFGLARCCRSRTSRSKMSSPQSWSIQTANGGIEARSAAKRRGVLIPYFPQSANRPLSDSHQRGRHHGRDAES